VITDLTNIEHLLSIYVNVYCRIHFIWWNFSAVFNLMDCEDLLKFGLSYTEASHPHEICFIHDILPVLSKITFYL